VKGDSWPAVRDWGKAHIAQEDWLMVGSTGGQLWLVSALPSSDVSTYPLIRDWVRAEVAIEDKLSKSILNYVEVDCDKQRSRNIETYLYAHNNLRGSVYVAESGLGVWDDAPKNSIRAAFIFSICRGAR